MNRERLLASARLAGQVLRYHTWPVHRQQSVGEHTWQVLRIYTQIFDRPSSSVFITILYHDAGELVTGDPPFPFKARNPEIKLAYDQAEMEAVSNMGGPSVPIQLTAHERLRIKTCDLIEMIEFGLHEIHLGNRYAYPIVDDVTEALHKLWRDRRTVVSGVVAEHVDEMLIDNYMDNEIDWTGSDRMWARLSKG